MSFKEAVLKLEVTPQITPDDRVVMGGVYEQTNIDSVTKVPFFGDLPYLGALFKTTLKQYDKAELLIFVTPKIVKDSLNF